MGRRGEACFDGIWPAFWPRCSLSVPLLVWPRSFVLIALFAVVWGGPMPANLTHAADQKPKSASGYDRPAANSFQSRSVVMARSGIVATSQPLAAQAGLDVLKAGGNAIDAAIAANAVIGLTEPMSCGIG